jgi:glycosyltransferase involved in cell wall biosynthesis
MFGEAAYEASLHSLVDELGLSGRVEFAGFREDVQRELLDANVLVHASLSPEPFGQVVVEGMAAGLPVVAAAAGGPAEIIESEVNGLLFTPGSVSALATELQRLAQDEALRDRLGAQARIRAALFRPEKVGENVMTLYLRLLERTARRDETKAPWRLGRRTAQGAGQPTGLSQSPYLLRE